MYKLFMTLDSEPRDKWPEKVTGKKILCQKLRHERGSLSCRSQCSTACNQNTPQIRLTFHEAKITNTPLSVGQIHFEFISNQEDFNYKNVFKGK